MRARFKKLICRALDKSPDGGTFDDVEQAVLSGEATLWEGDESVAVTESVASMNVWLFAGNLAENLGMSETVEAHARAFGVEQMTVTNPRKGWGPHLEAMGYVKKTVYVKDLNNGR